MRKSSILVIVALLLAGQSFLADAARGQAAQPATLLPVQLMGPVKIGPNPPAPVPPDNPQTSFKIALGKMLYFDTRISKDNTVSCATCHNPKMGWSDAGPTSEGIRGQKGGRRAPPVSNAAYLPLQFWDGRAQTLEDQAKGPIQNPIEMGNTHEAMIQTLKGVKGYQSEFEEVFGPGPITVDHVAKAIAAFERTVVTTDSPFDRYVRGDENALTPVEKKGLEIFNGKGHCTACHWGSNFSDGRFHNLGVAQTGPLPADNGRFDITKNPADMRAFKTPTVRDAGLRPPYMHTGGEKTLRDVVVFYNKGGGASDKNLDPLMVPLGLSKQEIDALVAFLTHAMTSLNVEVADVKPVASSDFAQ